MTEAISQRDDKRNRILAAARDLFLRYGVRRTSMDDVAREAGIAKGTVYLYFRSKEDLFTGLAEDIFDDVLARAREAASSSEPLAERLTQILDLQIGGFGRLIQGSPHVSELMETKQSQAADVIARFYEQSHDMLGQFLKSQGIADGQAVDMFRAAAFGCLKTGDASEEHYRKRLRAMVDALLDGLRCRP